MPGSRIQTRKGSLAYHTSKGGHLYIMHETTIHTCQACGKPLTDTRRTYCDHACRQKAYRARQEQEQEQKIPHLLAAAGDAAGRLEQLEAENEGLRAENARLGTENDRLSEAMESVGERLEADTSRIAALEAEIRCLQEVLDVETRFRLDTEARFLQVWLKKQTFASGSLYQQFKEFVLSHKEVSQKASRAKYETELKRLRCKDMFMTAFQELWKAMLLQS